MASSSRCRSAYRVVDGVDPVHPDQPAGDPLQCSIRPLDVALLPSCILPGRCYSCGQLEPRESAPDVRYRPQLS